MTILQSRYEYASGVKGYHFCRQQEGTSHRNSVDVLGSDGNAVINVGSKYEITGKNKWIYNGREKQYVPNPT